MLNAIYGRDGKDRSVRDAAFNWDAELDWKKLRVGYLKSDFERKPGSDEEAQKEEPAVSEEEKKKRERQRQRRDRSPQRQDPHISAEARELFKAD